MVTKAKNDRQILLRQLGSDDLERLLAYLHDLSADTRRRFGPHPFDRQSVIDFYNNPQEHWGYVAQDFETGAIVAYSLVKVGYLQHDGPRLQSYNLSLDMKTDCTFAPSVADAWQSQGVGNSLWAFILNDLKAKGIKRVILWGGVQSDNERAVNFYMKNGFRLLGRFEYNGWNDDMILEM